MDEPATAPPLPPASATADGSVMRSLPTAARTRWRVQGAIVGLVITLPVAAAATALAWRAVDWGLALAVGAVLLVAATLLGVAWANRRHERFGYALDDERLRVRDGVVIHTDAVAPLFRVQHVDLTRGPLQLSFGLATLTVHTASPAADVRLPDLRNDDAERIRDDILTSSRAAAAAMGVEDLDAV